jgi:hypothetical protein
MSCPTPWISLISTNWCEFSENSASSKPSRLGVSLSSFYLHSRTDMPRLNKLAAGWLQSHQLIH